jgi:hypothetical protein
MDPNTVAAEIKKLQGEMRATMARGASLTVLYHLEADIRDRLNILREWRRKGGPAPRDGWPHGL